MLVEATILLAASRHNGATCLRRTRRPLYKVDTDAIAAKVKQEFAAKAKAKKDAKPATKAARKRPSCIRQRGGEPAAPHFFCAKNRAGRTRFGFSLHPHPAAGPRSPAARQESSSSSCTFPLNHKAACISTRPLCPEYRFYCGNVSRNIGFPLFDCQLVASS